MHRIRAAAALALLATLTLMPQAVATHKIGAEHTVAIPDQTVDVPVEFCLWLDEGEPTCLPDVVLLQGGTLTLAIAGTVPHALEFAVDNTPCTSKIPPQEGVAIFVKKGLVSGTVTATLQGTGAFESVSQTIERQIDDPGGSRSVRTQLCTDFK